MLFNQNSNFFFYLPDSLPEKTIILVPHKLYLVTSEFSIRKTPNLLETEVDKVVAITKALVS